MNGTIPKILREPSFPEDVAWRRHHLEANQVILREGEEGSSLFFIEEGRLRVTGKVELEAGRQVRPGICDLQAGDVFGELCLFGRRMRTATVAAITEARVVEIDGELLDRFLETNPELGYRLLRELFATLADRLGRTDRQMENLLAWGLKAHGIERHL